mmetsp:Transcript_24083/g.37515  ORF Transcript_24083/g.37515 Transcript_24083/m.37515 type:complete len:219 (-) Transcript_24083:26-682(-)
MKKPGLIDEERTINNMVAFIAAEAREKELEIDQQALEEHDIEKQRLIERGKKKMLVEFESKMANLEISKRVSKSHCTKQCQLELVREKHKVIDSIKDLLRQKSEEVRNNTEAYRRNLTFFIEQAIKSVLHDAEIVCLREDVDLVEDLISEFNKHPENYNTEKPIHLRLSTDRFLEPESLGGIIMRAKDGKIQCDNTVRHRIDVAIDNRLPEIREILFT